MKIQLNITKKDIDKAIEARAQGELFALCCPTAQSLKRLFKTDNVSVNLAEARVIDTIYNFSEPLTEQTTRFTENNKSFKPGTYEIWKVE